MHTLESNRATSMESWFGLIARLIEIRASTLKRSAIYRRAKPFMTAMSLFQSISAMAVPSPSMNPNNSFKADGFAAA